MADYLRGQYCTVLLNISVYRGSVPVAVDENVTDFNGSTANKPDHCETEVSRAYIITLEAWWSIGKNTIRHLYRYNA